MNDRLLKEAFKELMNAEIHKYEAVDGGLSLAEKFHVWANDNQYLVKITPERLSFEKYEVLKRMYDEGIRVAAALKWKYYPTERLTVLIYDWILGENLEDLLKKCSDREKEMYGEKAAELIKAFHNFDVFGNKRQNNPYGLFKRYSFCLMRYRAGFPYMKEINTYIKERRKTWKSCVRLSLIHQDLRPENILVYNDNLYMIDFETAEFADPYSDFVFCISMQPDYQLPYSRSVINAYFNNNIPEDFWQWTLFYGAMAVQKYAIWKYKVKHKKVKLQAIHFYELYSGLTSTIPAFWREKKDDTESNSEN